MEALAGAKEARVGLMEPTGAAALAAVLAALTAALVLEDRPVLVRVGGSVAAAVLAGVWAASTVALARMAMGG